MSSIGDQEEVITATGDIEGIDKLAYGTSNDNLRKIIVTEHKEVYEMAVRREADANEALGPGRRACTRGDNMIGTRRIARQTSAGRADWTMCYAATR